MSSLYDRKYVNSWILTETVRQSFKSLPDEADVCAVILCIEGHLYLGYTEQYTGRHCDNLLDYLSTF